MSGIGQAARTAPDATAIAAFGGASTTYAELDDRQARVAGMLLEAGLTVGDRVAVFSANRPEFLEVTIGALRAGIVPVPVNALLTQPEVAYILEDSGAKWLFTDKPLDAHPDLEHLVTFGDAYERSIAEAQPAPLAEHPRGRPMHYTSGTTGHPKGVWVEPYDERRAALMSNDFRSYWTISPDDIHLVCSPLAHSAPHRYAMRTLESGGTVVLQPRFDARETLAALELFGVTTTFMVPTHMERMLALDETDLRRADLSGVRMLIHAGAPIREETKHRAIELFPPGSVWEFYGSTEGHFTRISSEEWLRHPGSVGTPRPGAEILITDERGRAVAPGEVGEVWVRDKRAERFSYWADKRKTRAAWRNGAFTAGDLGRVDEDGYLFLTSRKHDVIITGGVNVYPQEVEHVLAQHPSVSEVVVYGVADEEWGQTVQATIVGAFGQPLDPEALRKWARERLAGFKVPRAIHVAEELPTTATGKVKRPSADQ